MNTKELTNEIAKKKRQLSNADPDQVDFINKKIEKLKGQLAEAIAKEDMAKEKSNNVGKKLDRFKKKRQKAKKEIEDKKKIVVTKAKPTGKKIAITKTISVKKATDYSPKVQAEIKKIAKAKNVVVIERKAPKERQEGAKRKDEAKDVVNRFIPEDISKEKKEYIKKNKVEEKIESKLESFMETIREKFDSAKVEDIDSILKKIEDALKF